MLHSLYDTGKAPFQKKVCDGYRKFSGKTFLSVDFNDFIARKLICFILILLLINFFLNFCHFSSSDFDHLFSFRFSAWIYFWLSKNNHGTSKNGSCSRYWSYEARQKCYWWWPRWVKKGLTICKFKKLLTKFTEVA